MSTQYDIDKNQVKIYYPNHPDSSQAPPPSYQPMGVYQATTEHRPVINDHLGWSICNTVCCVCSGALILACAIPALIFSIRTKDLSLMGRYDEARESANYARVLNIAATIFVVIGIVALIILMIFYVFAIFTAFASVGLAIKEELEREKNETYWRSSTASSILLQ